MILATTRVLLAIGVAGTVAVARADDFDPPDVAADVALCVSVYAASARTAGTAADRSAFKASQERLRARVEHVFGGTTPSVLAESDKAVARTLKDARAHDRAHGAARQLATERADCEKKFP